MNLKTSGNIEATTTNCIFLKTLVHLFWVVTLFCQCLWTNYWILLTLQHETCCMLIYVCSLCLNIYYGRMEYCVFNQRLSLEWGGKAWGRREIIGRGIILCAALLWPCCDYFQMMANSALSFCTLVSVQQRAGARYFYGLVWLFKTEKYSIIAKCSFSFWNP